MSKKKKEENIKEESINLKENDEIEKPKRKKRNKMENSRPLTFFLRNDIYSKLDDLCIEQGTTKTAFLEKAINIYMDVLEKNKEIMQNKDN